jgi:hypothetical protein
MVVFFIVEALVMIITIWRHFMIPESVLSDHIPQHIVDQFKEMRTFVENLPTIKGEVLTCHAMCEALIHIYPDFVHVEGTFGGFYEHSWIAFNQNQNIVLDMYPVAGACPFIIYKGISLLPWFRLYEKKPIKYDVAEYRRQVEKILVTKEVGKLLK